MMLPALPSISEAVPGTIVAVPLPAKPLPQTPAIKGDSGVSVNNQKNKSQQKGSMTAPPPPAASASSQSTAAITAVAISPSSSSTRKNDDNDEGWATVRSIKSIKAAQRSQNAQAANAALTPPAAQTHCPTPPTRLRPAAASTSIFPNNNNNNNNKIGRDRKKQQQQRKAKEQGQGKPRTRPVIVFDANNKLSWADEVVEAEAAETVKERDAVWKKIKPGSAAGSAVADARGKAGRGGEKGNWEKKKGKEGNESKTDNRKAEIERVTMREKGVKKGVVDASLGNNRFNVLLLPTED